MVTVKDVTEKYQSAKVLYEDKYVKVCKDHIEIKNYYFPTTTNKKISINDIQCMYYRQQEFPKDCFVTKDWGMTLTPCWWTFDLTRTIGGKTRYNVVLDTGSKIKKGFTVENLSEFLPQVNFLLRNDMIVANQLPF